MMLTQNVAYEVQEHQLESHKLGHQFMKNVIRKPLTLLLTFFNTQFNINLFTIFQSVFFAILSNTMQIRMQALHFGINTMTLFFACMLMPLQGILYAELHIFHRIAMYTVSVWPGWKTHS